MKYEPIARNERNELIDSLRGFALFGILMVNMLYMYAPMSQMMLGAKADATSLHIIAESFIKFFFEGKFYVVFSMLFGFGFYIFMNKESEENPVLPIFRRRLLILLLFGIAHISLLWVGDVLVYYSLFGFILILFRKSSDKKIIVWAIVFALIPILLFTILALLLSLASQVPEVQAQMDIQLKDNFLQMKDLVERAISAYSTGSFGDIFSIRIEEYFTLLSTTIIFFSPVILSMFLLGYLFARKGLATNSPNNSNLLKNAFSWGLVIGLFTNVLYVVSYQKAIPGVPDYWSLLSTSMHIIGGFSLGISYVSGIALFFVKGKSGLFTKYLAPVGRMALTNYILQSVITSILFHSYGFALYGKVEVWQGILLTMFIYFLQLLLSQWWLTNFRYGPLEWLWRSLTYSKIQPIRFKES